MQPTYTLKQSVGNTKNWHFKVKRGQHNKLIEYGIVDFFKMCFKNFIPQALFHTKTLSRKHLFIQKEYFAFTLSFKKPHPTITFSCKTLIPQTLFHVKTLSRKDFFI